MDDLRLSGYSRILFCESLGVSRMGHRTAFRVPEEMARTLVLWIGDRGARMFHPFGVGNAVASPGGQQGQSNGSLIARAAQPAVAVGRGPRLRSEPRR
jgi:hypothetical protein